jgi:23S rRNA pseudouridine1911/1915/1917 synthase
MHEQYFTIVHEDNHLIVVNKKAGVPSQGDKSGDTSLTDYVREYIRVQYQKPGNVFTGLIHRLDRPVSGLVLLAKTSKALERMNKVFHDRQIQKVYWAIVKNKPSEPEGKLVHWLTRNQQKNLTRAHKTEVADSQRAELDYRLIASIENYHLLEVRPLTGRQHQIRVQLAAMGTPIKGDIKYGFDRTNKDGSICLHARRLSFEHPIQKMPIEYTAPVPESDIWTKFALTDL